MMQKKLFLFIYQSILYVVEDIQAADKTKGNGTKNSA